MKIENEHKLQTNTFHRVVLFGIPIASVTMREVLDKIHDVIAKRSTMHIGVVNAAKIVNMHRNKVLMEDVLSSDIILADGAAVVLASKILRKPLPERVTGIDLMYGIFEDGNKYNYRVYCLGATEEISERVAQEISNKYPNLILAGRRNGYFSEDEEESIVTEIKESNADVLLVAMTSPKKENFLARWNTTMNVPVIHGVGGSFDVMAGKVERAPEMWRRLGLEWLYRVKQEPRRLWKRYLVTNTLFIWMLTKELFSKMRA
jgi:N-acetylglucosaminyldiphosphoundecaprenol N-acetyl-beta-D-mannosaminyltransferase